MMRRTFGVGLCVLLGACGANPKPQISHISTTLPPAPVVTAVPQPPPAPTPVVDPVAALVSTSRRHFESGEQELKAGHLEKAREDFDRSVEVLLEVTLPG